MWINSLYAFAEQKQKGGFRLLKLSRFLYRSGCGVLIADNVKNTAVKLKK